MFQFAHLLNERWYSNRTLPPSPLFCQYWRWSHNCHTRSILSMLVPSCDPKNFEGKANELFSMMNGFTQEFGARDSQEEKKWCILARNGSKVRQRSKQLKTFWRKSYTQITLLGHWTSKNWTGLVLTFEGQWYIIYNASF